MPSGPRSIGIATVSYLTRSSISSINIGNTVYAFSEAIITASPRSSPTSPPASPRPRAGAPGPSPSRSSSRRSSSSSSSRRAQGCRRCYSRQPRMQERRQGQGRAVVVAVEAATAAARRRDGGGGEEDAEIEEN